LNCSSSFYPKPCQICQLMELYKSSKQHESGITICRDLRKFCLLKHHRIPAPELSFDQPNLSFLVKEIVENLLK
jgi:hypothetical protein